MINNVTMLSSDCTCIKFSHVRDNTHGSILKVETAKLDKNALKLQDWRVILKVILTQINDFHSS